MTADKEIEENDVPNLALVDFSEYEHLFENTHSHLPAFDLINSELGLKGKEYYYSHKEQKKIHDKTYRRKHRNEINEKNKLRCRTNINYRLAHTLRIRVWKVLKGINKSKSTLELLGCSIEQLKDHLEKQFTGGMSFNNYGKWHIDHKRPCASFNLSKKSEQRKCFHYTNLQPLWAEDNIRKH
jgi:hypothetical protein